MKQLETISELRRVDECVYTIRGQRVMFAQDLASFYGIETKRLMQSVRRNLTRFPEDFAFALTDQEFRNLRSQIVTSSWGGTRYAPMAFTELGVAMLSSVLNSEPAIAVNIEIMRAFVRMRSIMVEHADLKRKVVALERKYDDQFKVVFDAIHEIMSPPTPPKKPRIGF